tara:strand:+ start:893 stop:2092 length:1200 start_codon:yes stop_codon:yes gene_type:complete
MDKLSNREKEIIDLGLHPYADTFLKKNQLKKSEPVFPLKCYINYKSGYIHNFVITNDNSRYNEYEYSYTSANSIYSRNYWEKYCLNIKKNLLVNKKTKILEIGSNDGYLLSQFKKVTKNILGVDASKFMTQLANKKGIRTKNLIFDIKNSNKCLMNGKKINIIIANNVLNHSNDPLNFIKGVKNIIDNKGTFVFELPYWVNLVKAKKFDQIYHEHVSYFTVKYSKYLLNKAGFKITNIEETEYHGGSIRIYSSINKSQKENKIVKKYIAMENSLKIFKEKTYVNFMNNLNRKKLKFLKRIINYKLKGYKIIGVGAAAKGNTFLNFIGINNQLMDFITDASKYKIGKYTPLTRIPIFSDNKIKSIKRKICLIPLAWNLEKFIKTKLLKLNKNMRMISFYK